MKRCASTLPLPAKAPALWSNPRFEYAALLGVGLLALALRLYGIAAESLWLDEATSLMLARMSIPTLVEWTALDIHPPLYYILLHFWIALGESEAIIRGLSLLAGMLNVLVIYDLGRTLFDGRTGLLSAILLALAPFHIWYSQEARMYAWITLLVSSSILLAIKAWRGRHWIRWAGYVLVTTAALYTHYYAVFAILLENLFFLYLLALRRVDRMFFWRWAAAQVAIFVLFLPWFPTFLLPITVGGGGWITLGMGRPSVAVLAQTAVLYMVGIGREAYPALVRRLGYLLFVGLFVLGLWPRPTRKPTPNSSQPVVNGEKPSGTLYNETEAIGFCLAYLVLPLGIAWVSSQIFKPMYSARYMLPFLIPFLLLVARGIRGVPWAVVRGILLIILLAVMGLGVFSQAEMMDKPDWRGLAARLIENSQEGDLILFMPGWQAKPFDYYAQGRLSLCSDIPIPIDQYREEALAAVKEAIGVHPRIWFVWEAEHYTDSDSLVYGYLRDRCPQISEVPLPLETAAPQMRVILFENPQATGRS